MNKMIAVQVEHALQQWISALDVLDDPIFIHDADFRILRCNRAYQHRAGIPFAQIVGRPFYTVFPIMDAPPQHCIETTLRGNGSVTEEELSANGTLFHSRAYAIKDAQGRYLYSIHILEDVTRQREAQNQLRRERDFSDKLIETAPVIAAILDPEGRIVRINRYLEQLTGYSFEAVRGKDWFETFLPEANRKKVRHIFLEAVNDIDTHGQIDELMTQRGKILQVEWYSKTLKDSEGNTEGLLAIGMDVTEQRKVQKRLELFHILFQQSRDAIEIVDPATLRLLDVNETNCRQLGYSRDELLTMKIFDIDPTLTPERAEHIGANLEQEGSFNFETLHRRRDGSVFPVEISASIITVDKPYMLSIIRDISERKAAEAALQDSEEKFRTMTASAQDAILMMDNEGRISYWNEAAEKMFGYTADEALGHILHHFLAPERFQGAYSNGFKHFTKTGEGAAVGKTLELAAVKRDGTEFPIELSLSSFQRNGQWHAIGIIRDISGRKASEAALSRANRALRTLSAGNLALVRAASEKGLLKEVVRVIVENGGYSLAVVDYADAVSKRLRPVARAGFEGECNKIPGLSLEAGEQRGIPAVAAIREKSTQICRDISRADGMNDRWRKTATSCGYVSNIALPLFDGSKVFGVLSIYSTQAEPFDEEEVQLLEELASDLAYGILNQRTYAAHKKHEGLLREGLEQTVLAIAATLESRDPYTAGHQKRVAELATAIANEMGLAKEQVEGIRFAATIHDLGKIHIPAEILSKPGRLTDLEYKLVQTHPQAGHDIVKDVRFPWPIARIILQHHEHIDGSGYPQGLRGDQILIEAKIITVADIVEAISSHRPYRSALGLPPALDAIKKGRGTLYDPDAVDACLKLFNEKQFVFNNNSGMELFD